MKVAFFGVKSWERAIIEKEMAFLNAYGVGIFEEEVQDAVELALPYNVISVFIYSQMKEKVLKELPNLKYLATRSTGVDHIDEAYCEKNGIGVGRVREYGTRTVAEYAWALILSVTKKVVVAHQAVENGEFTPEGLTGTDLFGHTLGVVGVGRIGLEVVKFGRAFGMKVLGVEKNVDEVFAKKHHFKVVDLETCLRESDVISMHVPSIPATHHLINKQNIKLMKPGSYLVNTCRGPVVESEALIWALNKGILAGAGLDVIEEEQIVENISVVTSKKIKREDLQHLVSYHMLRDRDDVVFTPHNAFNTRQAIGRIVKTTILNINNFLDGKA